MTAPSPTPSERLRALADDARLFWNGHTPALRYVEPDDVRALASDVAADETERNALRAAVDAVSELADNLDSTWAAMMTPDIATAIRVAIAPIIRALGEGGDG